MPCLDITLPRTLRPIKDQLARELTDAFSAATGHSGEIFSILFHEYAPDQAYTGGRPVDASASGSPYVHFHLFCPRLRRSSKQKVVAAFTERFTRVLDLPGWAPVIHISEHPYDNVGIEGALLSDKFDECAKRPFYYELPRDA